MPITINKNSSATILEIRNFQNLTVRGRTTVIQIPDVLGDEEDTILLKDVGPGMTIDFEWIATDEATSVVTGTGSPVTTAVGQMKYLMDTLMSKGTGQLTDTYTLTLDFGGGGTFVRTGSIVDITPIMTEKAPLTFIVHIAFEVGTVP